MFWQRNKGNVDLRKLCLTVKIVIVVYKRIEIVYVPFRVVEGKMECEKSSNSPKWRQEEKL